MERLILGWSNDTWGADPDYLMLIAEHASKANGPVVECGSGLSTLVAAAYSRERVWSLEHMPEWARRVRRLAETIGLDAMIFETQLTSYGDYDWYVLPEALPSRFGLIICDGPPADTRGGRYGALPVLSGSISGATVLLDDAHRIAEQDVLFRWSEEFGANVVAAGRHAVVTLPSD